MHLKTTYNLRLGKKFAHLNTDNLISEVEQGLEDFVWNKVIAKGQEYPPVPDGSKYERTERLKYSYKFDKTRTTARRFVLDLYNDATDAWGREYAKYVIGPSQTWFHKAHGWIDLADYFQNIRKTMLADIRAILNKHLD